MVSLKARASFELIAIGPYWHLSMHKQGARGSSVLLGSIEERVKHGRREAVPVAGGGARAADG